MVVQAEVLAWYMLVPAVCVQLVGQIHMSGNENVVRAIWTGRLVVEEIEIPRADEEVVIVEVTLHVVEDSSWDLPLWAHPCTVVHGDEYMSIDLGRASVLAFLVHAVFVSPSCAGRYQSTRARRASARNSGVGAGPFPRL